MVPEPYDCIALVHQKLAPLLIVIPLVNMVTAVQFDNQRPLWAAEVSDIGTDGILASKLGSSELAVTEPGPKLTLGLGRFFAQPACSLVSDHKGVVGWDLILLRISRPRTLTAPVEMEINVV